MNKNEMLKLPLEILERQLNEAAAVVTFLTNVHRSIVSNMNLCASQLRDAEVRVVAIHNAIAAKRTLKSGGHNVAAFKDV